MACSILKKKKEETIEPLHPPTKLSSWNMSNEIHTYYLGFSLFTFRMSFLRVHSYIIHRTQRRHKHISMLYTFWLASSAFIQSNQTDYMHIWTNSTDINFPAKIAAITFCPMGLNWTTKNKIKLTSRMKHVVRELSLNKHQLKCLFTNMKMRNFWHSHFHSSDMTSFHTLIWF